ncbi:hypothetical protein D3C81_1792070 [compost metagenome]
MCLLTLFCTVRIGDDSIVFTQQEVGAYAATDEHEGEQCRDHDKEDVRSTAFFLYDFFCGLCCFSHDYPFFRYYRSDNMIWL